MDKQSFIYILTNKTNTVLYTGVTNDLKRRVYEHKNKLIKRFTRRYNITKLIYYEIFNSIVTAIEREKQIKAGSREDKIALIGKLNPEWQDLYDFI